MVGFCKADINPLGPVQLYVAPTTAVVNKVKVEPWHTGLLLVGLGVPGVGLMVTFTVPAALVHPATVTVREYVPVAAKVALGIVGFCSADMNPLGPVQL